MPSAVLPQAVLLIGPADLRDLPRPLTPGEVVTLVSLPTTVSPGPVNTLRLVPAGLGPLSVCTRTVDGSDQRRYQLDGAELLDGIGLGPRIAATIRELTGRACDAGQHTPLFAATADPSGWHTFSRVHLRPDLLGFIRTSPTPVPAAEDDLAWLPAAVAHHGEHAGVLNSHDAAVRPAFTGREVETKFTLPPHTPIWTITVDLHRRVQTGHLPDAVPRFRDDLELWDFTNHLFEVTGPGDEGGYVSFMGIQPGTYRIKRKNYRADALIRPETVSAAIHPDRPLDAYVRDVLHLQARGLPSFRRIRHDVKFELLTSGNHYGIFLDRCTLTDAPDEALVQCEIEYLWSRRVLPLDEPLILAEVDQITTWTAAVLAEHGVPAEPGFYSKLSYLREVAARRPDLRPHQPLPAPGGVG